MFTKREIREYISERIPRIESLVGWEVETVEEITENTQVNYVYQVTCKGKGGLIKIFLKHATDTVKSKRWPYPTSRIRYEALTLKRFKQLMGDNVVPDVLFYDDSNKVLWLSDIRGETGKLLIDEFAAHRIHKETAGRFGQLIGRLHGETYGLHEAIRSQQDEEWTKRFIYEFKTAGARKFADDSVKELLEQSEQLTKKCLLGVDFADKNIFVDGDQVRFCDFEAVFMGDPAFDVGHIIAHYVLQVENDNLLAGDVLLFINEFMKAYVDQLRSDNVLHDFTEGVNKRSAQYVGIFMLHRSHGKSPYEFFKPGIGEVIKKHSLRLIHGSASKPGDILGCLNLQD